MNENIKNEDTQKDVFSELYYLKTYILMAENIVGQSAVSKRINYKQLDIEKEYTEDYILEFIEKTQKDVLSLIPEAIFEYYVYSDYEAYTDKYYHRMFFNEIENDDIVDNIFDIIVNHFDVYDCDRPYCLSLYDFNNAFLYFKSEKDMNTFFDEHDIVPCTAYKNDCTVYVEMWSS